MTRIETDSMGPIEVPADRYWGAQTQRSLKYFAIGDDLMPHEVVRAFGVLKKAAAQANADLGVLPGENAELIVRAADELIDGALDDHFPLHVWQTGSGTQSNMNANEVLANRANELAGAALGGKTPIHPNDDVNRSQSSNGSFPTAMNIAAAAALTERLLPAVRRLRDALAEKAADWTDIVKIGRTHLQDAVPLTLGQEFGGYATMLDDGLRRVEQALAGLYPLALGGTAVGTGLNAPPGFAEAAAARIAELTGLPFTSAPDKFAVTGAHDAMTHASAALRTLAVSLFKIANDIRLLSCGPRAGLREIEIPANEPGSSIMPGKVNPTQCEALAMVCVQVTGLDAAVAFACASGHLELNVYRPLMIFNVLESIRLLSDACGSFTEHLVVGMRPDLARIRRFVNESLMLVTALTPEIGYDKAAEIAKLAYDEDLPLRDAALRSGYVDASEYDRIVDPARMAHPHD
jgi:fumarate hydratase class II